MAIPLSTLTFKDTLAIGITRLRTPTESMPLPVSEIAREVGLHPDYAVTLFRNTCGIGLEDYLTQPHTRLATAGHYGS